MNESIKIIKQQIKQYPVLLYMKGTPNIIKCGFSAKAVQILSNCIKSFMYIDVLQDSNIRSALPKFSNWPTFPQLWIEEKLIGGSDIILDMYQRGDLKKIIDPIKLKYNLN